MAYYPFNEIARLAKEGKVRYATNDAVTDAASLDIEDKLSEVLLLLQGNDFNNSVPDCDTLFGTLDADSYLLWCDLDDMTRAVPRTGRKIYIKVAIHLIAGMDHESCLVISIHPDKYYTG